MKKIKGKAFYNPDGKAGEYAHWACWLFQFLRKQLKTQL